MRSFSVAYSIPLILPLAACAYPSDKEPQTQAESEATGLAGTQWELVEVADAPEAGREPKSVEPGLYTMALNADGTASFRLDCNRGFGKWQSESGGAANSGTISISDIGVTKALCPPGSISDQVTANLSRFNSFELTEARLILSAENGAIVYQWSPKTLDAENVSDQ